jgi:hypothetical protein
VDFWESVNVERFVRMCQSQKWNHAYSISLDGD